jgi:hypothetical protein
MSFQNWINLAILLVLAVNLIIFGMIAVGICRISSQLERSVFSIVIPLPDPRETGQKADSDADRPK